MLGMGAIPEPGFPRESRVCGGVALVYLLETGTVHLGLVRLRMS
jgi:hypothetical protein